MLYHDLCLASFHCICSEFTPFSKDFFGRTFSFLWTHPSESSHDQCESGQLDNHYEVLWTSGESIRVHPQHKGPENLHGKP